MLDGLTILMALPNFVRSARYPLSLRLAVAALVIAAFTAALALSLSGIAGA